MIRGLMNHGRWEKYDLKHLVYVPFKRAITSEDDDCEVF
jgi:hypothetical protein